MKPLWCSVQVPVEVHVGGKLVHATQGCRRPANVVRVYTPMVHGRLIRFQRGEAMCSVHLAALRRQWPGDDLEAQVRTEWT